jgi:hypothetical protein
LSLFQKIHDVAGNPTDGWMPSEDGAPAFDRTSRRFGPLSWGDPIDAAAPLGRPDHFRWTQPGYCELLYARAGFQIDFDRGGFSYLAYLIGPDPDRSEHPGMQYSTPVLDAGVALTRDTSMADLRQSLGPPASEDVGTDETVLFYTGDGLVLEFEFDAAGHLKRWNLYPDR